MRVRNQMKKNASKSLVPLAHGLIKESRDKIWESLISKQYLEKAYKCNIATNARTRRIEFTYKLGPQEVVQFVAKFVSSPCNFFFVII